MAQTKARAARQAAARKAASDKAKASRFTTPNSSTVEEDGDDLFKALAYIGGGAIALPAIMGMGGIGIVGGMGAIGLSVLELAFVGAAAGGTAAYIDAEKTEAKRAQKLATKREQSAAKAETDLKAKIATARKVLDDLEA